MRCFAFPCLLLCGLVTSALPDAIQLPDVKTKTTSAKERNKRAAALPKSLSYTSTSQSYECSQQDVVPRSCAHAHLLGHAISGVYEIDPRDGLGSFNVFCDMETDAGGWTVFQRRKDGSEDFFRGWNDYVEGFGELYGEFWLGLDKIHRLAVGSTLRVDLMASDVSKAYALYEDFTVGNAKSLYVMYFGRYTGTAGDSLRGHNGMKFTTKDKDNDKSSANCATSYSGAFWYGSCYSVNVNGIYSYGSSSTNNAVWHAFKEYNSLQKIEMKLK